MIIHEKPKYLWLIELFFPFARGKWDKGLIITFHPWIFCKANLPKALIAHEETHLEQQKHPVIWWIRYIFSVKFRLSQEIEAHRNEYRAINGSKNEKYRQLNLIAERLCGPLYKNLLTKEEAIEAIR